MLYYKEIYKNGDYKKMYRLGKKLLGFFITFGFFLLLSSSFKVFAWEAHLNEAGDIEIYTVDKKKTSSIWYYSDGVSITRCKYNPALREVHESSEYFFDDLNNATTTLTGGIEYNTWTIPISEVISMAGNVDGAWAEEIQKAIDGTGPAVYIKLDCIMYTVEDATGIVKGPFVNAPGVYGSDGYFETGADSSGMFIRDAYPWANPNGLRTHYNHYLLIGSGEEEPPEDLDDEFVVYDYTMDHYAGIDANQPAFAMGNFSSQFDLSQGIPSSEYIQNTFLADSWYGNTNVYARVVGKAYTWNIRYYWLVPDGYWHHYDSDNDGIVDSSTWIDTSYFDGKTMSIPVGTAYAAFQFLADTHLYDFTNADIGNGAYDGDHVYYDDTREVPMTCISTSEYKNVGTGTALLTAEPHWRASTDSHLEFPRAISYLTSKRVSSESAVPAEIIKDRDAIREQISGKTKTRNDKLIVDGTTFMQNDWVNGCNFLDGKPDSYRSCTKSSAWVKDYCKQAGVRPLHEYDPADVTGSVSVQIPPTVDNGYYYTTMKVFYQRLTAHTKSMTSFYAGE